MLAVAEAVETSEAVQPELWQLCRTLTGCTGDQLNDVYAHVDVLDTRATLLGLQQTLAALEPQVAASVVRRLLRSLQEAGMRPIECMPEIVDEDEKKRKPASWKV